MCIFLGQLAQNSEAAKRDYEQAGLVDERRSKRRSKLVDINLELFHQQSDWEIDSYDYR